MIVNGVDVSNLEPVCAEMLLPAMVKGRTLHLDGDMLAYELSCWDDVSFGQMKLNCMAAFENRMAAAGAEFIHVHLTGGDKGGRYELARVKEYQANRKGKEKPKHLGAIKDYMASKPFCTMHTDQEADDGMAQANYEAINMGHSELSVIMSGDKDLTMCSGWHCDWYTFEMTEVMGYGVCDIVVVGKTKKVKGFGTSFFWHQMLMGDTADNIPGLPKTLNAKGDKFVAIGAVAAHKKLEDCSTDQEAFEVVRALYTEYWEDRLNYADPKLKGKFEAWNGWTHSLTVGHMFFEQAHLLWMRRVKGTDDITHFLGGIAKGYQWYD